MIPRYSRLPMTAIWSDRAKWEAWLGIELLVCEAWGLEGKIPPEAVAKIKTKAKINPARIEKIEKETKHDVIAFVSAVAETVGVEGRFLHLGLTSSDILDTSLACQFVKATSLLESDLKELLKVLKTVAKRYESTLMMGRTHGIHAEPITFGFKVATWYAEMKRQLERLETAKETIAVGKISGAVGTYSQVPPSIEAFVLDRLGLAAETPATQIVSRDRHAFYFNVLAGIASSIEKIAVEIRHLSRTEIGELAEPFAKGQKGSSAMPHKQNPILSENLTGLARLVRAYAQAAFENVALWHERDISHSSVERVIAPDATIVLDFMIHRMIGVLKGLNVYPAQMKKNLEATRGVVFSQEVLRALIDGGKSRERAYRIVQKEALRALQNGADFRQLVKKHLTPTQQKTVFDLRAKLKNIRRIVDETIG